jgi:hypothetical protein
MGAVFYFPKYSLHLTDVNTGININANKIESGN